VIYDLGVEYANHALAYHHLHRYYCARLWKDFSDQFGVTASNAFSSTANGFGVGYMIDLFLSNNFMADPLPMPGSWAIDSYGKEYEGIKRMWTDIKAKLGPAEAKKKIRIFETRYNDAEVAKNLLKVIRETGINFGGIMQWGQIPGQNPKRDPYFEDGFTWRFDQYRNL
jgi:hypothetical protein